MSTFGKIESKVLLLKTDAKNDRDMEMFSDAIENIEAAINLLEGALNDTETGEGDLKKIKAEIADCYGIKGGIYRRWGLYENNEESKQKFSWSHEAYEKGNEMEEGTSYNKLNGLVSQIMCKPEWINTSGEKAAEKVSLSHKLKSAQKDIQRYVSKNENDAWALADSALVSILLNEEDPKISLEAFTGKSPASYVYKSFLTTLEPLSKLDTEIKDRVASAYNFVKSKAPDGI